MQSSFSDAEYASKKKLTRRDRFLAEIEAATPWPALVAVLLPTIPRVTGVLLCTSPNRDRFALMPGVKNDAD